MLVLTRRLDESIRIGTDIHVRIIRIEGGKVRLAIDAPRAVPIEREELHADAQGQPRSAAA